MRGEGEAVSPSIVKFATKLQLKHAIQGCCRLVNEFWGQHSTGNSLVIYGTNLCRGVRPPRRHVLQVVSPCYVPLVRPLCSEGRPPAAAFSPLPQMPACAPSNHD